MKRHYFISVLLFLSCFSMLKGQVIKSESASITLNPKKTEKIIKPDIQIIVPATSDGTLFKTNDPRITIVGKVENFKGVSSVIVNSQTSKVGQDGVFQTVFFLEPGINKISILAINDKNVRIEKKIEMEYETPEVSLANRIKNEAVYYALIIAVDDYQDPKFGSLDNPVNDAQKLMNILVSRYIFLPENIIFLKNAEREDIIKALDELIEKIQSKDNLLIFFAGHGYWIKGSNVGFWMPSDASADSRDKWFSNSTLVDYIKEIQSKHVLLIADACFSGSIFKSRAVNLNRRQTLQDLYDLPSRKAITSGTLTEVPDQSAFTRFLIEELSTNKKNIFTSEQLFGSFRTAVINNSENKPLYGEIMNVGDKGGDFIFIKK